MFKHPPVLGMAGFYTAPHGFVMLTLALVIGLCLRPCVPCILLLNGWSPLSVGERTELADIVLVGRAIRSFKGVRTPESNTYAAEFRTISTLKGRRLMQEIQPVEIPGVARETETKSYNVTNFGDRNACYADVVDGEEYVMFLTTFERHLSAKYDDLFGALHERTREAEEEVFEALGWKPWSDWDACSATCGGGVQKRVRFCTKESEDECEGDNTETRNCNQFKCKGATDLTQLMKTPELLSSVRRLTHRPSAYAIDHTTDSINAPTSNIFPRGFPPSFTVFATFRLKPESEGYLFTINNLLGSVLFGLKTGRTIRVEFLDGQEPEVVMAGCASFDADVADGRWHQVALGVFENRAELVLDCDVPFTHELDRRGGDFRLGENTIISVGKSFVESRKYPRFLGDLEQLTIVAGTSAVAQQCSTQPVTSPLLADNNDYEDIDVLSTTKKPSQKALKSTDDALSGDRRWTWSTWSACSATCGSGLQARVSYCPASNSHCRNAGATQTRPCEAKVAQCPGSCKRPCRNGGNCTPSGRCRCKSGYRGRYCQTVVCDPPCLNGGRCIRPGSCSCPRGFTGLDCSRAVCTDDCYNGGTCVGFNHCKCPPGYYGNQCRTAICELGCENGGHCAAPNICNCPAGFTGKQCQTPICNPQCLNGGACVLPYLCLCPPGTYGSLCERFICSPKCVNGGSCIGLNACLCTNEYSGAFCQTKNCPEGCSNGGTCIGPKVCTCPIGFNGSRCEHRHCREEIIHEPYQKTFPKLFKTETSFPCGAFGWKVCNRTKFEYRMVQKTLYRTTVKCT